MQLRNVHFSAIPIQEAAMVLELILELLKILKLEA
jgi:hypothetical protein